MHDAQCLAGMAFSMLCLESCTPWLTRQVLHIPAVTLFTVVLMQCTFPKVIKFNSKEPEAAARYAKIAKFINLPGTTDEELTDALIARLLEMNKALDIPACIKDYEGGIIDEKEFMEKLPKVAELAVGDACTGSNPRAITPAEMEQLLKCCFYDEEVDF